MFRQLLIITVTLCTLLGAGFLIVMTYIAIMTPERITEVKFVSTNRNSVGNGLSGCIVSSVNRFYPITNNANYPILYELYVNKSGDADYYDAFLGEDSIKNMLLDAENIYKTSVIDESVTISLDLKEILKEYDNNCTLYFVSYKVSGYDGEDDKDYDVKPEKITTVRTYLR